MGAWSPQNGYQRFNEAALKTSAANSPAETDELDVGTSLRPYAYAATLWQAASPPPTRAFIGIGTP